MSDQLAVNPIVVENIEDLEKDGRFHVDNKLASNGACYTVSADNFNHCEENMVKIDTHLQAENHELLLENLENQSESDLLNLLLFLSRTTNYHKASLIAGKLHEQHPKKIILTAPVILHLLLYCPDFVADLIINLLYSMCTDTFLLLMHISWLVDFYLHTPLPSTPIISGGGFNISHTEYQRLVFKRLSVLHSKLLNIYIRMQPAKIPCVFLHNCSKKNVIMLDTGFESNEANIEMKIGEQICSNSSLHPSDSAICNNLNDGADLFNCRYFSKTSLFVAQKNLIHDLINIGNKMASIQNADLRHIFLVKSLTDISRNFTSSHVFLPWVCHPSHRIVKISIDHCSVLPSKNKAPFLVVFEVLEDINSSQYLDQFTKEIQMPSASRSWTASLRRGHTRSHSYTSFYEKQRASTLEDQNRMTCQNVSNHKTTCSMQHLTADEYLLPWKSLHENKIKNDDINDFRMKKTNNFLFKSFMHEDTNSSMYSHHLIRSYLSQKSEYADFPGWNIYSAIIKTGDDLRQDWLASYLIRKCRNIWLRENVPCWLCPYEVIICNKDGGLIETVPNAYSLHHIKKISGLSLSAYFFKKYSMESEINDIPVLKYQKNFVSSLAGYSIIQYLFRIRDRHNGNILLDDSGHVIHVDFGFMLEISPRSISFETSPFKLTQEFVEIMGGEESFLFLYFRSLITQGLFVLRSHIHEILDVLELMCYGQPMACMASGRHTINAVRSRFLLNLTESQFGSEVANLVNQSLQSITTRLYDRYQYYTNGIL